MIVSRFTPTCVMRTYIRYEHPDVLWGVDEFLGAFYKDFLSKLLFDLLQQFQRLTDCSPGPFSRLDGSYLTPWL